MGSLWARILPYLVRYGWECADCGPAARDQGTLGNLTLESLRLGTLVAFLRMDEPPGDAPGGSA